MGAHALPVFAVGCVLAILGQAIKTFASGSPLVDSGVIFAGLAVQLSLALLLERRGSSRYGEEARPKERSLAEGGPAPIA
jgi:hypothetical protein